MTQLTLKLVFEGKLLVNDRSRFGISNWLEQFFSNFELFLHRDIGCSFALFQNGDQAQVIANTHFILARIRGLWLTLDRDGETVHQRGAARASTCRCVRDRGWRATGCWSWWRSWGWASTPRRRGGSCLTSARWSLRNCASWTSTCWSLGNGFSWTSTCRSLGDGVSWTSTCWSLRDCLWRTSASVSWSSNQGCKFACVRRCIS